MVHREQPPDPPRVAWRKAMRAQILTAARKLTCDAGWDQVSLSAVAAQAHVSRPFVYREFGNRAGLGRALVTEETRQFLEGVAHALGTHQQNPGESLEAAVHFVLTEAEENPLVHAVVTAARRGSDSLLPYLTARPDPVVDAAQHLLRTWLGTRFPTHTEQDIALAADIAVRMTISHLILPSWHPRQAAANLSQAVLRTLAAPPG